MEAPCICDPHDLLAVSKYLSGLLLLVVGAWEGVTSSYLDKAKRVGCAATLGPLMDKSWRHPSGTVVEGGVGGPKSLCSAKATGAISHYRLKRPRPRAEDRPERPRE